VLSRWGRLDAALPALARALKHPNEWVRVQAAAVADALGEKARPLRDDLRAANTIKNEYLNRLVEHALGK
jgi:hypothetical protein